MAKIRHDKTASTGAGACAGASRTSTKLATFAFIVLDTEVVDTKSPKITKVDP
jgi:hypothetical protein